MHKIHRYLATFLAGTMVLWVSPSVAQVDCDEFRVIPQKDSYMASPKDVRECQQRGHDAPVGWRVNGGKNPGIKASGAGGFSYGSIGAPENPPTSRNAQGSVTSNSINASCKINGSSTRSCSLYYSGVFKPKDNLPPPKEPSVAAGPVDAMCPEESDNTGEFGVKVPAPNGGNFPVPCSGFAPLMDDTREIYIQGPNPTMMIVVDDGADFIRFFKKRKDNGKFQWVSSIPVPRTACNNYEVPESSSTSSDCHPVSNKIYDLTQPVGQVILLSTADVYIPIKLKPRQTMPSHYIPPYDGEPEPSLKLLISSNPFDSRFGTSTTTPGSTGGFPSLPPPIPYYSGAVAGFPKATIRRAFAGRDGCSDSYFPSCRQPADIFTMATSFPYAMAILPEISSDCEIPSFEPTAYNDAIYTCVDGSTIRPEDKKCVNRVTGVVTEPTSATPNWVFVCPRPSSGMYTGPQTLDGQPLALGTCPGKTCHCPQNNALPPVAGMCPSVGGAEPKPVVDGKCDGVSYNPDDRSMCPTNPPTPIVGGKCAGIPYTPPEIGGTFTFDTTCQSTMPCDVVPIPTKTEACYVNGSPHTLHAVLKRPGVHFPEGTDNVAVLNEVIGSSTTPGMPGNVINALDGSRLFMTPRTVMFLGSNSPPVTLNEGAELRLSDGSIMILSPDSVITPSSGTIVIGPDGAQRASAKGVQMASYAKGETFVGGALLTYPLEFRINRSVSLSGGMAFPGMTWRSATPYIRMPADPLPQ